MKRFSLLDAMALIAAVTIGLAIFQGSLHFSPSVIMQRIRSVEKPSLQIYMASGMLIRACQPSMLMLTVTLTLIGLKQRQAGTVFCIAALAGVFLGFLWDVSQWATKNRELNVNTTLIEHLEYPCFAVIGAYIALRLSKWTPETNWVDKAGKLIALAWVLAFFLYMMRDFLC